MTSKYDQKHKERLAKEARKKYQNLSVEIKRQNFYENKKCFAIKKFFEFFFLLTPDRSIFHY